ncbi:hypothetical protein N0824_03121 [Microcystis sp. 0824]|nr:hypothetical protein N0824_03121 [Microcystis sp. 0824]
MSGIVNIFVQPHKRPRLAKVESPAQKSPIPARIHQKFIKILGLKPRPFRTALC